MTTDLMIPLAAAAAVLCGMVAGVFLAFSDFVMRALSAARPAAGAESMQLINRKVYGSVFLVLLLGLVPVSLAIAAAALTGLSSPAAPWLATGGAVYLTGVFAVTMLCNVPMNRRLDALALEPAGGMAYWGVYARSWTRWNHARTLAATVSALCYGIGCMLLVQG